jgi:hypothetical protein
MLAENEPKKKGSAHPRRTGGRALAAPVRVPRSFFARYAGAMQFDIVGCRLEPQRDGSVQAHLLTTDGSTVSLYLTDAVRIALAVEMDKHWET